jgi:hypothetical protein
VIDARLAEQLLDELAIGAFEGAHKGALLGPALPHRALLRTAVVTDTGHAFGITLGGARFLVFRHRRLPVICSAYRNNGPNFIFTAEG